MYRSNGQITRYNNLYTETYILSLFNEEESINKYVINRKINKDDKRTNVLDYLSNGNNLIPVVLNKVNKVFIPIFSNPKQANYRRLIP